MDSPEQPENPAAGASKPVSRLEAIKNGIEMFSKIILGVAAACFVCGIIVVNLYLREFGVASFSMFRVSYITAGFWTFSPVGFAALVVGTFLFVYFQDQLAGEQVQQPSRWMKWKKISIGMIASVFVIALLFSGLGIPPSWKWLGAIFIGACMGLVLIAAPVSFLQSKTSREKLVSALLAFVCVSGFVYYILFLAPSLYSEIPASVGGGAGMPVVFVVSTDKQELVKAAGLTFAEPMRTDQVTLLLQTDKEYVVLAGNPRTAITLSADLVSAIRHAPPRKSFGRVTGHVEAPHP
jgi:hypothetical protein